MCHTKHACRHGCRSCRQCISCRCTYSMWLSALCLKQVQYHAFCFAALLECSFMLLMHATIPRTTCACMLLDVSVNPDNQGCCAGTQRDSNTCSFLTRLTVGSHMFIRLYSSVVECAVQSAPGFLFGRLFSDLLHLCWAATAARYIASQWR